MKRIAFILLLLIPAWLWAYSPPVARQTVNDRLLTNAGQSVELQAVKIDGKPNPNFVKYRNAYPRLWLRNGDDWRILAEVNGEVLDVPLAKGSAACAALQRQPIFVRVRIEQPTAEPEPEIVEVEVIR